MRENKTVKFVVRFTESDAKALKKICPKNVSSVIREAVKNKILVSV